MKFSILSSLAVASYNSLVLAEPLFKRDIEATQVQNTSTEYFLKTHIIGNTVGKERFDGLYAYSYHIGAGISDLVFNAGKDDDALKGYLGMTNETLPDGSPSYYQLFDLSADYAWAMVIAYYDNFAAAWEPVRVEAGAAAARSSITPGLLGYHINEHGLRWRNDPTDQSGFGGWIVCDWWHSVPQLFTRVASKKDMATPCNCADVDIVPEYF